MKMDKSNDVNTVLSPSKTAVNLSKRIDRLFLLIAAFWTIVIMAVFTLNYRDAHSSAVAIAKEGLVESYNKDLVYRRWAAIHGGVYVRVTPDSPPSPYLAHIPERDISTPSGKKLTLINPAYMTRQVQELAEKQYSHKGHITSLNPLRPENSADEWERKALLSFEHGAKEASSFQLIGNETYLRFMRPFLVEQSCLSCHESQGYKLGEIRGGISVSTPWKPAEEALLIHIWHTIPIFAGIWLIGIFGMFGARSVIKRNISERERADEERLEMEKKLLHTQKLESLAVMAGGIAHDFNNLLQVVLGNLDLALDDIPPDSKARTSILNAIKASERSAELSHQMLTYSGTGFYKLKDLDLSEEVRKNESLLKLNMPKTTSLHFEINEGLPLIRGDADQIQRVITSLVINASEAIGANAGEVTVRTGVMDCDESYLSRSRMEARPDPGEFVFIEATDTGCGMDAETQHKLFDPFFSTKFWGRGLGMAEVMGIVKGHHGAIMVDSQIGKGTTISVLFPVPKKVQVKPVHAMDSI
jgi:signal transduction histidine kinase